MTPRRSRLLAIGLTVVSATLLVLYATGPAQCSVPVASSLSLYDAPMWVRPAVCAMDSPVQVWLLAVAELWLGLSYLLLARGRRPGVSAGSPGS